MTLKRESPSARRNCEPILDKLANILPYTGRVLEIASGTGQHAVAAASRFSAITWQPSDADPLARDSTEARRTEANLPNLLPPLVIDVEEENWWSQINEPADVVVCINMIHISPWIAGLGLLRGATKCLTTHGHVFLYGPYKIDGAHTAPSNEVFDHQLRSQNKSWGVRDINDIEAAANANGLNLVNQIQMPANNFVLILQKKS